MSFLIVDTPETHVFPTARSPVMLDEQTSSELVGRTQRPHSPERIVQAVNVPRFGRN